MPHNRDNLYFNMHKQPLLGQRIRLSQFATPYTITPKNGVHLAKGSTGTIRQVYDSRTIGVQWDSGTEVMIAYDAGDRWELI